VCDLLLYFCLGQHSGHAVQGASTQFGGAAVMVAPAACFVIIPGLLFACHRAAFVLRSCVCHTPVTRLSRSPACLPALVLHCWVCDTWLID
jgi:hypothetical protein